MLVRLVPIRGGRPSRFGFKNILLDARRSGDIGSSLSAKARVGLTGDRVHVRPLNGYVAINGVQVHDATPVRHGDIIKLRAQDVDQTYQFEADLRLGKTTRRQQEAARGVHRSRPELPPLEDQIKVDSHYQVAVDEGGITVVEKGHTRSFAWDELDAIELRPVLQYAQSGGHVLDEIAAGVKAAGQAGDAHDRDVAASDVDVALHAPAYEFRVMQSGKTLKTIGLVRERSVAVARSIDYFAPVDLIWFGELAPEPTPVYATTSQPVSSARRSTIEAIVDRYASSIHDKHVYFRHEIQPSKLSNALQRFAPAVSAEAVLLQVDHTLFNSGKEGVLLTAEYLYEQSGMGRPRAVPLDAIESVDIGPAHRIVINGKGFHFENLHKESVQQLASMLREIVALRLGAVVLAPH